MPPWFFRMFTEIKGYISHQLWTNIHSSVHWVICLLCAVYSKPQLLRSTSCLDSDVLLMLRWPLIFNNSWLYMTVYVCFIGLNFAFFCFLSTSTEVRDATSLPLPLPLPLLPNKNDCYCMCCGDCFFFRELWPHAPSSSVLVTDTPQLFDFSQQGAGGGGHRTHPPMQLTEYILTKVAAISTLQGSITVFNVCVYVRVCVCVCVCGSHVDGRFGFPLSGLSFNKQC